MSRRGRNWGGEQSAQPEPGGSSPSRSISFPAAARAFAAGRRGARGRESARGVCPATASRLTGVQPAALQRRWLPWNAAPLRSAIPGAPRSWTLGTWPGAAPAGSNATCGSNVRRRGPGAPSQAGRRASAAAGRGTPRAPRRRAAPAGTRRRGRAGG